MCPHAQIRDDKTIRCLVVHDVALLRHGLRRLLEDEADLKVVAEAENAAEALREISEQRPDVVIADANLFGGTPTQAEEMILHESPASRVVFLPDGDKETQHETSDQSRQALRQTSAAELLDMVRDVAQPESSTIADPAGNEVAIDELATRKRSLTTRELEVLKLLAEGRTVRSVAEILGLSVKTVDAHKFNLMRKLGIHNKAELVMWAIRKNVVKLPVNF
ncbi:MAG TPA: response regulator transcription factor [Dongiaceae bacterium]|nr:response regulator transcription factor [Dongiaceae bacterium]